MSEKEFINFIGNLAKDNYKKSGILASITIAQACLESGYGTTDLAKNANNLFGMKCNLSGNNWKTVWDGKSKYTKITKEEYEIGKITEVKADFRKYPNISYSIEDHSLYLTQAKNGNKLRYKGLVGEKNYKKAIQIIKDGGYATDSKYVDKICNLINRWNLTKFDKIDEENKVNIIDVINDKNVPKWGNSKKYIAIHYLGVVGQNNKVERNGYGAHYYIYWDGTIYQAAKHDAILWQVGTGGYYTQKHPSARNSNTIGIELCVKCDGNSSNPSDPYWYFTTETQNACVKLVKKLMKDLNIPASNVLRHYDIVNKYCPAPYVNNNKYKTSWTWNEFKSKISESGSSSGGSSSSGSSQMYRIRKSWNDERTQIGAYENLNNAKKACKPGYTVYDKDGRAVYSNQKNDNNSSTVSKKELIKMSQTHLNNYVNAKLTVDGIRGSNTIKASIKGIQQAMNMDYGNSLIVDGIWGTKSDAKLKGHTVRKGESQEMVRILQICLLTEGFNPGTVDGKFGLNTENALEQYQKYKGLAVDKIAGYNTFKSFTK